MLILLLTSCAADTSDTGDIPVEGRVRLVTDEHVALPFITLGQGLPQGTLSLTLDADRGSTTGVTITPSDDFNLVGDDGPLAAGETRTYTVRYSGDASIPLINYGHVTLAVEDESVDVTLSVVIGDPDLPDASWTADAWGERATLALPSAPFPYEGSAYDDPSVLVFVPDGLSDRGDLGVVTHLHGHNTTIDAIVAEQHLVEQHALSGRNAILIVPQGPVDAASGDFGRLAAPDGHANLVRDVLSVLYRDGVITRPNTDGVVLTAHSGGYLATAAILDAGGLPVTGVHLFDALYGERATFAAFAEGGGVFRSSYTATGGTTDENEALADDLAGAGLDVGTLSDVDLYAGPVGIAAMDAAHAACVSDERAYARWLATSGLPHRPSAAPELLSVVSDGDNAVVTWQADAGGEALRYRVEGSEDGSRWSFLTDTGETTTIVAATPWIRVRTTDVRYGESEPSDTYGGTGADWLVVDGFDRVLDGSWSEPVHPFAATVGNALGAYSVATNEAVASGAVRLSDYPRVLWLLGDEGTADRTFDPTERAAVQAYVDAGGTFVASGAEVAYATDPAWLDDVLHAALVSDDAATTTVEGWTVGDAYPEDYPDVLTGDEILWSWSTGGAAAVGWDGRVAVIGFGLENLSTRELTAAVAELVAWLE
jgi:hypothetical protein